MCMYGKFPIIKIFRFITYDYWVQFLSHSTDEILTRYTRKGKDRSRIRNETKNKIIKRTKNFIKMIKT